MKPNRSQRNPWAHVTKVRFFWLLVMLVGFILAIPSFPSSARGQWELMILGVIIFFSIFYVSQGTARIWAMVGLVGSLTVTGGLYILDGDPQFLLKVILSLLLLTLLFTATSVLNFVLDEGAVGIEHIFGAICAYILIAMAFGTLDFILELSQPGAFSGVHMEPHAGERPWGQFLYFSFTTLSTVGYGDIVPVTPRARSFAILEQLVAVFYVAILISRLTGMYTPTNRKA